MIPVSIMRNRLFKMREAAWAQSEECAKIRPIPGANQSLALAELHESESDARLGEDVARDVARGLDLATEV
jgi:hypothetical protein